jgi:hypothetical protein
MRGVVGQCGCINASNSRLSARGPVKSHSCYFISWRSRCRKQRTTFTIQMGIQGRGWRTLLMDFLSKPSKTAALELVRVQHRFQPPVPPDLRGGRFPHSQVFPDPGMAFRGALTGYHHRSSPNRCCWPTSIWSIYKTRVTCSFGTTYFFTGTTSDPELAEPSSRFSRP